MSAKRLSLNALLLVCLGASGCATNGTTAAGSVPAHDNTDSVVWIQVSSEYAAATAGVYAAATDALAGIAETEAVPLERMAIVLDVDETVLDNSPYQAQLVFDDDTYGSETWDRWIEMRAAAEVPGVVDFLRRSQSLGVHVAFITNRACRPRPGTGHECPQKRDTLVNLRDIGIDTSSTTLYLRGERPPESCVEFLTDAEKGEGTWSSDKTSRRACVARERDIIMLFGDQLGDFIEEHGAASGRDAAAEYEENWGRTWFMLPNPTYGGWKPRTSDEKRELMQGTD